MAGDADHCGDRGGGDRAGKFPALYFCTGHYSGVDRDAGGQTDPG